MKYGHTHLIELLIRFGSDVNEIGINGIAPLLTSVKYNNIDCTIKLLKLGSDIHVSDIYGKTVLHYAVYLNEPIHMIKLLIDNNAIIEAKTLLDQTPLKLAYTIPNMAAIEMLGGRTDKVGDNDVKIEVKKRIDIDDNGSVISGSGSFGY